MTALPTEKVIYPLEPLLKAFTEALNTKAAKVANYKGWATEWPQGNTRSEQLVVDWLLAQQRDGLTRIETKSPITDFSTMGNIDGCLSFQIKGGLAKGIK